MHSQEQRERTTDTPRVATGPPRPAGVLDAGGELTPRAVVDLQRAVGNAAVARMIEVQRMPDEGDGKRKRADTTTEAGPEQQRPRTGPGRFRRGVTRRNQPDGDRPAELRMLDRIARILYNSLEGWDQQNQQRFGSRATPHFAVNLDNGRLHVSGNTDRPFTADHRQQAERRLRAAVTAGRLDESMHEREAQDLNKIRAHLAGDYRPDEYDNDWMADLASALQTDIRWDIGSLDPQQERGAIGEVVHGEMILLGDIVKKRVAKGPAQGDAEREPEYLGGYLKPCKPCRWLIESVNAVFGNKYGFRIATMETHEGVPRTWHAPDWLFRSGDKEYAQTWKLLKMKAANAGTPFVGNRLNAPKQDGGSKYAPRSDSEYDEE
jgi:hypothetical protein